VGALDYRKAAAKELEHQAGIDARIEARIAALRLERERVVRLGCDFPCKDLEEAVDHIDTALLLIGAARRHLEPQ
jgi:hypothetical protein